MCESGSLGVRPEQILIFEAGNFPRQKGSPPISCPADPYSVKSDGAKWPCTPGREGADQLPAEQGVHEPAGGRAGGALSRDPGSGPFT